MKKILLCMMALLFPLQAMATTGGALDALKIDVTIKKGDTQLMKIETSTLSSSSTYSKLSKHEYLRTAEKREDGIWFPVTGFYQTGTMVSLRPLSNENDPTKVAFQMKHVELSRVLTFPGPDGISIEAPELTDYEVVQNISLTDEPTAIFHAGDFVVTINRSQAPSQ